MKKATADLSAIADAMEMQGEEHHQFFDRETGEIHLLSDEDIDAADGDRDITDYPEWQQAVIQTAREVIADTSNRYVELPDKTEIDEYRAMEGFAASQTDAAVAEELLGAIRGSGAFRRFKAAVHRLGLADRWYAYRDQYLLEIARDWCEAHEIPCEEKPA